MLRQIDIPILYIFLSFLILFLCAKIAYRFRLVDIPNQRKMHKTDVAFTGGIAISLILLLLNFLYDDFNNKLSLIISVAFLVSIVGFIDDKYHLNIGGKLSLQIIPIFYVVVFGDLVLKDIGNYDYFILDLGNFSAPFTILSVLFLINSFNYFDGLDGTLGLNTISVLIILYFINTDLNNKLFLIKLIIPILLFLIFNFSIFNLPKLFLGDSGSLLLGFIVSFLLIYLSNISLIHPIILAWSIVLFVFEFISINLIRLKNNQNLFRAGKDHLHHIFLDKTKSLFLTNSIIVFLNLILFLIGYYSFLLINSFVSLILFLILFFIYFIIRDIFSIKVK